MDKKMSEFEYLRTEIISILEQQRNVWIYMYVVFVAIFVLGVELKSSYLFLITYIILIPFQTVINRYMWCISRLSTYIRVFYEEDIQELNWESMQVFIPYKEYYEKFDSDLVGKIRSTGVTQLAFLSTVCFNIFLLKNKYNKGNFNINLLDIFFMTISIVLFLLTLVLNQQYKKNYVDDLETVIRKYKKSLNSNIIS